MNYENRIVCFLDILGFQKLINSTVNGGNKDNIDEIKKLSEAITDLRYFVQPPERNEEKTSKQITQFSDCIVFSFLISEKSHVFYTLLEIQWILINLVSKAILCRGGIGIGKLIHTNKLLFGPALIDAYHYESKCANYPRVIVPEEIISIGKKYGGKQNSPDEEEMYIRERLGKDSDGMYYVDYFRSIKTELDHPYYDYPQYLQKLSKIIANGLLFKDPAIKIKYLWMKEKYNSVVKELKSHLHNLNDDPETKAIYESLALF